MILSKNERDSLYNRTVSLIRPGLPTEGPLRGIAAAFQNEIDFGIEENLNFEKDLVYLLSYGKYLSVYDMLSLAKIENDFRKIQNLPPCFVIENADFASFRYYGLQEDSSLKRFNSIHDLANFYNELSLYLLQGQNCSFSR